MVCRSAEGGCFLAEVSELPNAITDEAAREEVPRNNEKITDACLEAARPSRRGLELVENLPRLGHEEHAPLAILEFAPLPEKVGAAVGAPPPESLAVREPESALDTRRARSTMLA